MTCTELYEDKGPEALDQLKDLVFPERARGFAIG